MRRTQDETGSDRVGVVAKCGTQGTSYSQRHDSSYDVGRGTQRRVKVGEGQGGLDRDRAEESERKNVSYQSAETSNEVTLEVASLLRSREEERSVVFWLTRTTAKELASVETVLWWRGEKRYGGRAERMEGDGARKGREG